MNGFANKPGWFAWVLAAVLLTSTGAGRRESMSHPTSSSQVRVRDWAIANKFGTKWLQPDAVFQLTKGDLKIILNCNSRQAEINGVQVWLLKPFEYRAPAGYLSQLDLDHTIYPLLHPPRSSAKIRRICLDPGHGGKDPGSRFGSQEEQRYTLALAYELKDQLTRAGFKVTLTRAGDTFVDLPVRPAVARKARADLFLSLHFNATDGPRSEARGTEVFCLTPAGASSTAAGSDGPTTGTLTGNRNDAKNLLLAWQVQKALLRALGTEDRGVRRGRLAVLRDATMPAILIEAGFLSHPVEGQKIIGTAYRREIAAAIVDGVRAYQRVVESKG